MEKEIFSLFDLVAYKEKAFARQDVYQLLEENALLRNTIYRALQSGDAQAPALCDEVLAKMVDRGMASYITEEVELTIANVAPENRFFSRTVLPFTGELYSKTEQVVNARKDTATWANSLEPGHIEQLAGGFSLQLFQAANYTEETYLQWLFGDGQDRGFLSRFVQIELAERNVRQEGIIARNGFCVVTAAGLSVKDGEDDVFIPDYAYTAGMQTRSGCEFVAIGQPVNVLSAILNWMCGQMVKDDRVFLANEPFELAIGELADGSRPRAMIVDVLTPATSDFLGAFMDNITFNQLVLPDKNNILPGESGYDETFIQSFPAPKPKE